MTTPAAQASHTLAKMEHNELLPCPFCGGIKSLTLATDIADWPATS